MGDKSRVKNGTQQGQAENRDSEKTRWYREKALLMTKIKERSATQAICPTVPSHPF